MVEDIKEKLEQIFKESYSYPFLFVGSGFSQRYLNTENWEDLLRLFCEDIQRYEYYVSKANGYKPSIATLMAQDFNEVWWHDPKYDEDRENCCEHIRGESSALKCAMSNHFKNIAWDAIINDTYEKEIESLKNMTIDGVITTNWDLFLEYLFPDYEVYIGQEELIFSSQQSIAEIYKIHGCCTRPNTLLLTAEDYEMFESKNAYLASKLITLFVEHPIIFIGTSVTDTNIGNILKSIVKCLGPTDIDKIRNNLIFVQRTNAERLEGIVDSYLTIDDTQIPIKQVVTESFVPVYEAINSVKRKIPPKVLRYCKEQFYELVRDNDPNGKLSVTRYEDILDKDNIEFYVGIGVISERINELGYTSLKTNDLFLHYLKGTGNYESKKLLEFSLPDLSKRTKYYPVYKYLLDIGISSLEEYNESGLDLDKLISNDIRTFRSPNYKYNYLDYAVGKTLDQVIGEVESYRVCYIVPFMPLELIDIDTLETFIESNCNLLDGNYGLYYRKLVCLYDYLKYGFD